MPLEGWVTKGNLGHLRALPLVTIPRSLTRLRIHHSIYIIFIINYLQAAPAFGSILACFSQNKQAKLMKNEKAEVKDNKELPGQVSTCFEDLASAEMMQKIMGEKGIGSLSAEMMRSLTKKLDEDSEESQKTKKEEK
jgi:hypothetical protein